MKILIVGKIKTNPVRAGNSRLIIDQSELLKSLGHEVHYLYISEQPIKQLVRNINDSYVQPMQKYWRENFHWIKIGLFRKLIFNLTSFISVRIRNGFTNIDDRYSSRIHEEINRLNKIYEFDACIVNYYGISKSLTKIDIPIKALMTHDIYTYRHIITGSSHIGSLTPNDEAKAMQRAPHILCVQEEDAIYLSKLSPKSKIYTTFTSVKLTETPPTYNHNVLYLSGDSKLNLEGIEWFIKNVLPLAINKWTDVKLIIGGGICNSLNKYKGNKHIRLVGYIDNPEGFFKLGDIAINPTMHGTGLKIKTIESLCYEKIPIVHPHSAIGLFEKYNCPLFISDNKEKWVEFMDYIWGKQQNLLTAKSQIKPYIQKMNEHIIFEYNRLLQND